MNKKEKNYEEEFKKERNQFDEKADKYADKTSELGRRIIYGLLGIIWLIIFSKSEGIVITKPKLFLSLQYCCLYLGFDYFEYLLKYIVYKCSAYITKYHKKGNENVIIETITKIQRRKGFAVAYFFLKSILLFLSFLTFLQGLY